MRFPDRLLSHYGPSMTDIGKMMRHELCSIYRTIYGCDNGDIIDIGGELYIILTNYGYDKMVECLSNGARQCVLPTTACYVVGHVNLNQSEVLEKIV